MKADWAERIPAALAKAEGIVEQAGSDVKLHGILTAGEVALAKALWAVLLNEGYGEGEPPDAEAALRAFVEKVEGL